VSKPTRVLVTGATGLTGGALCRRLAELGSNVAAFARPSSRVDALRALGVDVITLDVRDREQVLDAFPDVDVVYHIAAAYRAEHLDVGEFERVNVDATKYLLEAAAAKRVARFVHCSTVGVHGDIEEPPAEEDYRFAPHDYYQRSKLAGEMAAREYFEAGKLRGAIIRPAAIYGPGDTRFLKLFRAIDRGLFAMIGSGKTLYHMVYIDDLVQAFVLAGNGASEDANGEAFIIGGPRYITIDELVATIADVLGRRKPRVRVPFGAVYAAAVICESVSRVLNVSPPLYRRRVEFFHMNRAFKIDKARSMLGYEPRFDLRAGLEATARWYRTEGLL
jgi:nucleoside-diphosphate-sugar epimerase